MNVYPPNSLLRYVEFELIMCIDICWWKFDNSNRIEPEVLAYFVLANKKGYFVTNEIKSVNRDRKSKIDLNESISLIELCSV